MSINKIFLIFLLFNLSFSQEPPTAYDELVCGKKNPKKEEDCTEYGTGSGMVCCFISDENKKNRKCRLVPDDIARGKGISGYNTFPDYSKENERYWHCGNDSKYLYLKLFNILLFLILL